METKILGFSGRKQSGKNTGANFIYGYWMKTLEVCNSFCITEDGKLYVDDLFGDTDLAGVFDPTSPDTVNFRRDHLDDFVKIYSFADVLKETCQAMFGLTREQCHGTDENKNTLIDLYWENMPGVKKKKGQMTARDLLQFWGTEIGRKMDSEVWVKATLRKIKQDNPLMALISDCRFENEAEAILNNNGQVIRLKRDPNNGADQHPSETGLDNYPEDKYLAVIDNSNMTIGEQNSKIVEVLSSIKWLPKEMPNG